MLFMLILATILLFGNTVIASGLNGIQDNKEIFLENGKIKLSFNENGTLKAMGKKLTGETYHMHGDEFSIATENYRFYLSDTWLRVKLKAAFFKTFYNPNTGWLGWWRSRDGELHDIYSDVPTSFATSYGLISKEKGKEMLLQYWNALEVTGFNRFDLGVPICLGPVSGQEYRTESQGYNKFPNYLNGGCCVSNTSYLLDALYTVEMTQKADMILDAMLKRQKEGVFPNGGGFQNGFVDKPSSGAEFFDWEGNPTGYEGHLVYSWGFLHSMLRKEIALGVHKRP
jgi:hypothetical protein